MAALEGRALSAEEDGLHWKEGLCMHRGRDSGEHAALEGGALSAQSRMGCTGKWSSKCRSDGLHWKEVHMPFWGLFRGCLQHVHRVRALIACSPKECAIGLAAWRTEPLCSLSLLSVCDLECEDPWQDLPFLV